MLEIVYNPLAESKRVAKTSGLSDTCFGTFGRSVANETTRQDAETLASVLEWMRKLGERQAVDTDVSSQAFDGTEEKLAMLPFGKWRDEASGADAGTF